MKKRMIKFLGLTCAFALLSTTAVMGKSFSFYLVAGEKEQTSTVQKTSSGNAYVDRTAPSGTTTVLTVNMCNSGGAQKSEQANIRGIGHTYLSYSEYGVNTYDFLALMGTNLASQNGGRSIDAGGNFTP